MEKLAGWDHEVGGCPWQALTSAGKGFLAQQIIGWVREYMSGSREKGTVEKRKRHREQGNHRGAIWAMAGALTGTR